MKKRLTIDIYNAALWIVTGHSPFEERLKMSDIFGELEGDNDFEALMSWNEYNEYGLFFTSDKLSIKVITHEVFHLTHRILEKTDANFDSNHHEQAAYLNGYLNKVVIQALAEGSYKGKKHNIKLF